MVICYLVVNIVPYLGPGLEKMGKPLIGTSRSLSQVQGHIEFSGEL